MVEAAAVRDISEASAYESKILFQIWIGCPNRLKVHNLCGDFKYF